MQGRTRSIVSVSRELANLLKVSYSDCSFLSHFLIFDLGEESVLKARVFLARAEVYLAIQKPRELGVIDLLEVSPVCFGLSRDCCKKFGPLS